MNLLLFLMALLVSFIAVRIGAIAFQLTGMEWPMAKFQSLSCFSGTGFTTNESECITSHPRRRSIASILMILGNAGVVTLIATFANTIRPRDINWAIPDFVKGLLPWGNLLIITVSVYLVYRFFIRGTALANFTDYLRSRMATSGLLGKVSLEELTVATGGYGVVRVVLRSDDPLVGHTIADSGLRKKDVTVLVVQRAHDILPNPQPGVRFAAEDKLICFGNIEGMRTVFANSNAAEANDAFASDVLPQDD